METDYVSLRRRGRAVMDVPENNQISGVARMDGGQMKFYKQPDMSRGGHWQLSPEGWWREEDLEREWVPRQFVKREGFEAGPRNLQENKEDK